MRSLANPGLLLAWLVMSGTGATSVRPDIYRCVGADDVPIFSDRSCGALGARDRESEPEQPQLAPIALPPPGHDCSRQIDGLQAWVRVALDAGDVNQLAGLYHWRDVSIETADRLIPDLQAISKRRLAEMEVELLDFDGVDYPVRLWLNQYDPERPGQTIRTGFNLIMNSGCWWLHGQY